MPTQEQIQAALAQVQKFYQQEQAGELEYKEPTEHQLEQWFFAPGVDVEIDNTRGNAKGKTKENVPPSAS